MTMNKIFHKLRSSNRKQYQLLAFCIFLSVFLISSFSFMYFGPTVQDFLPEGGDTRKLAVLLLGVTVMGCGIFTVYASTLFFRYKSREFGIFLALGEPKRDLIKVLFYELSILCGAASVLGILLGLPMSFLIWKLFELFLISNASMTYRFGIAGIFAGLAFALLLAVLLGIMGRSFVNRSNIMDILKAGQKTEMVKEIKPYALPLGVILIIAGISLGFGAGPLAVLVFRRSLPGTNLLFLPALFGIYLVLLSVVSQSRLGKNKKKFYKNMVSVSMMRFSAKSATRNMCVIVLLLFSCMFAAFYGLLYMNSVDLGDSDDAGVVTLHYPTLEKQITKEDIEETAAGHSVTLKEFREGTASNLVISYKMVDYDDGKYIDVNAEKSRLALFFSCETYNILTGQNANVPSGSYKTVTPVDYKATVWDYIDGLYEIFNPDTGEKLPLSFDGALECPDLYAMSQPYAYVINDGDYAAITKGLSLEYQEQVIQFGTEDFAASYDFAEDLLDRYIGHASDISCHIGNYDAWEEQLAEKQGEEYDYAIKPDYSADSSDLLSDWKYAPQLNIIIKQDYMQLIGIYVMLCLYIFIICLSAAAVMNYVRSISIAESNKNLFYNLERLGADEAYRMVILKNQLAKIFKYPAALGCLLGMMCSAAMSWTNDRRFTPDEIRTLAIMAGIALLILAFLYVVYTFSKRAAWRIIRL